MSLFSACQQADIEQIQSLLDDHCDLFERDENGRTVLHYCAEHSTTGCAQLFLNDDSVRPTLLNVQDNEGCSALHLACLNGNTTMVTYLCEQGADVQLLDKEFHSLIHWITVCGHLDLFDILVEYQAPVHTADIYGAFPIHYASQLSGMEITDEVTIDPVKGLAILKKLIDYQVKIDCTDEQRRTPFLWAASAEESPCDMTSDESANDALRLLYKAGANALHIDKDSLTALHCAATRGHASTIRALVELYECPLEAEDVNGCTALFYAVTLQHSDACQALLDLHANPNYQDTRGRTPSHCAALKGNLDALKRLIQSNADIWIKNKRGDYPIHEAVNAISLEKLRPDTVDSKNLQAGCSDVVRYMLEMYPKQVNIPNGELRTPLHLAASLGDLPMCQLLIKCGARVNAFAHTSAGNFLTPYDLARIRHHDACADYLLSHHGGQRGNLLAQILARRIQKFYRQHKHRPVSVVNQPEPVIARTTERKHRRKSTMNSGSRQSVVTPNPSTDLLLNQAKVLLENKQVEDRSRRSKAKHSSYLINDKNHLARRRRTFAKSRTAMSCADHSDHSEPTSSDKIIIQRSNSIATSVKLYERHKLIAEELCKLKQARLQNQFIVINRSLYKILIENAFNPQSRRVEEIEEYLEKLLKAYETELDAIRKRTKSAPPRRSQPNLEQTTQKTRNAEQRH